MAGAPRTLMLVGAPPRTPMLTLSPDGALPLPAALLAEQGWQPGQRFSFQVHHGVLVLHALAEEREAPNGAPETPDELIGLRIRLGLTRSVMATRLGVTPDLVRAWEEGSAAPSEVERARLGLLASDE